MRSEHLDGRVVLHGGDSRDVLKGLADASIDSVVTDPPYALVSIVKRFGKPGSAPAKDVYGRGAAGFMGKQWDTGEVAFSDEFWAEVLRVLKPGGHVVAFSGTRTYHRMAVAIEDAGFEIRDQLAWCYGSGFPKSHDVSKGIDKAAGAVREVVGKSARHGGGVKGAGTSYEVSPDVPDITAPATDAARQWQGWGTALKPAWEPIVLARKPLQGTVAANVLAYQTGALNIDGCRVGTDEDLNGGGYNTKGTSKKDASEATSYATKVMEKEFVQPTGRWPANIVHDGSDEVVAAFPSSESPQPRLTKRSPDGGNRTGYGAFGGQEDVVIGHGDSGSAARFFYSAKADKHDRIGSKHPTVKPVDLMQWLCRLVTPPGGTVLDPFAGSGSTGEAAWREGFRCVLIEREPEYQADIAERLRLADKGPLERRQRAIKQVDDIGGLFANDNGVSNIAA
jgi:DNA modification methylase